MAITNDMMIEKIILTTSYAIYFKFSPFRKISNIALAIWSILGKIKSLLARVLIIIHPKIKTKTPVIEKRKGLFQVERFTWYSSSNLSSKS